MLTLTLTHMHTYPLEKYYFRGGGWGGVKSHIICPEQKNAFLGPSNPPLPPRSSEMRSPPMVWTVPPGARVNFLTGRFNNEKSRCCRMEGRFLLSLLVLLLPFNEETFTFGTIACTHACTHNERAPPLDAIFCTPPPPYSTATPILSLNLTQWSQGRGKVGGGICPHSHSHTCTHTPWRNIISGGEMGGEGLFHDHAFIPPPLPFLSPLPS